MYLFVSNYLTTCPSPTEHFRRQSNDKYINSTLRCIDSTPSQFMSYLFVILLSMNVYRGLLVIFIFIACSSSEVTDDLVTSDTSEDTIVTIGEEPVFIPTTSSTTSTSSTSTTSTTIASEVSIEPRIQIICEPIEMEDEDYLGFKFIIYNGSSDLIVLNIVSWLDSSRADDLFIYDDLPAPNETRELSYWVDPTFTQYEMEMLVMDENDNFVTDYCLWSKGS
jgi:hypothetical protein